MSFYDQSCSVESQSQQASNNEIKCEVSTPDQSGCDYKTVFANNMLSRPHQCGQCDKLFDSAEKLKHHEVIHKGGYFCEICDKSFSSAVTRHGHMNRFHKFPVKTEDNMLKMQRKIGRTLYGCRSEGCKFVTHDKRLMPRHVSHKHPSSPRPRKSYQCAGCKKILSQKSHFTRHIASCKKYQEDFPRIVIVL